MNKSKVKLRSRKQGCTNTKYRNERNHEGTRAFTQQIKKIVWEHLSLVLNFENCGIMQKSCSILWENSLHDKEIPR